MSDNTISGEGYSDDLRDAVNDYVTEQGFSPELSAPPTEKYSSIDHLPDSVRHELPAEAQEVYRQAFDRAYMLYDEPEDRYDENSRLATCHAIAWDAVKKTYTRSKAGHWMKTQYSPPRA